MTEVRNSFCCNAAVREETEPVGLGQAEPGESCCGRERDWSGCIHSGKHRQEVVTYPTAKEECTITAIATGLWLRAV